MGILIKGGEVITAESRTVADVYCSAGKVQAVGKDLQAQKGDRVIDAKGKYVIPGGIDGHVHLALPFMGTVSRDDFDSGTACAVAGGTTTLIDFVIPAKGETLKKALEAWHGKSEGKARCDYAFHMAITDWNEGIRNELAMVLENGITSFKIFTAYKGALMIDDLQLFELMGELKKRGGMVTAHAVNGDVLAVLAKRFLAEGKTSPRYHPLCQPPEAEGEATNRVIELGHVAGVPTYIVHMTCREAVRALEGARRHGRVAYGETCTQYLLLDDARYTDDFEGAKFVLSPPLRKKADQEVLWNAIRTGTIQVLGTDHCVFDFKGQKDMGKGDFTKIPNGFNGLEERLPLLHTYGVVPGRIDMQRFVAVTATNPARLFGLYPDKGTIAAGSDADIVVFDPQKKGKISAKSHTSKCDYNVYEGLDYLGWPAFTLLRGEVVYEGGKVTGKPGYGRYLKRKPQPAPTL